ncbi:8495_t:CDS:2 [Racocetra persica]|uniref:8495_t:CDS:1 n=1 Tax=Racocetra persica TaxID=160502 RepID=A0ACA9QJX0_9GLOM|nr:8495_t:CDS:2 [Racocetra persica]
MTTAGVIFNIQEEVLVQSAIPFIPNLVNDSRTPYIVYLNEGTASTQMFQEPELTLK